MLLLLKSFNCICAATNQHWHLKTDTRNGAVEKLLPAPEVIFLCSQIFFYFSQNKIKGGLGVEAELRRESKEKQILFQSGKAEIGFKAACKILCLE